MVSGEFVEADKYAQVTIVIGDVALLPLEVIVVDEFVEEVEVGGHKVKLPRVGYGFRYHG